ncbi:MAG: cytochrome c biogenesis protein CcsA, partial [Candidatus Aenigmatarchaeota archaeon]
MGNWIFNLTIFLYLVSTLLYLGHLVHQRDFFNRWATWCLIISFCVHTLGLIYRFFVFGTLPFGSLPLSLSFYSWTLVGIFLLMLINLRIHVMGSFISSLAFIAVLISFSRGWNTAVAKEPISGILKSTWVPLHVTFSLVGDSLFALAFCAGILYLIQEYRLKKRKAAARISALPSLETLDRVNFR